MSRRKIVVGVIAMVLVGLAGAGFWFFGTSQGTGSGSEQQKATGSQQTPAKASNTTEGVPTLSASTADDLINRMLSSNPDEFASVWSQPATFPMPPSGTTLKLHGETVTTKGTIAEAKATLTTPNMGSQEVSIYFEYVDGGWKLHHIQ